MEGQDKVSQLYQTLKQDEVYRDAIPDEQTFRETLSDEGKSQQFYETLKKDSIYKDALPADFNEFSEQLGLKKKDNTGDPSQNFVSPTGAVSKGSVSGTQSTSPDYADIFGLDAASKTSPEPVSSFDEISKKTRQVAFNDPKLFSNPKNAEVYANRLADKGVITKDKAKELTEIATKTAQLKPVIEELTAKVKADPLDLESMQALGNAYGETGNHKIAEGLYKQVITTNPEQSEGYNGLGYSLLKQGKPKEAIEYYKKASELNPNDYQSKLNKASLEEYIGNKDQAKKDAAEAKEALQLAQSQEIINKPESELYTSAGVPHDLARSLSDLVGLADNIEKGKGVFALVNPLGSIVTGTSEGVEAGINQLKNSKFEGQGTALLQAINGLTKTGFGAMTVIPAVGVFHLGNQTAEGVGLGEVAKIFMAPATKLRELAGYKTPEGEAQTNTEEILNTVGSLLLFAGVHKAVELPSEARDIAQKIKDGSAPKTISPSELKTIEESWNNIDWEKLHKEAKDEIASPQLSIPTEDLTIAHNEALKDVQLLDKHDPSIPIKIQAPETRIEISKLLEEKQNIEQDIEGKDPALVKPDKERINQINIQLEKLADGTAEETSGTVQAKEKVNEIPENQETGRTNKEGEKPTFTVSDHTDRNGRNFIASDGEINLGEITPEIGQEIRRQSAPVRLSVGDQDYGKQHIEIQHGEQLADLGYSSVEEFVKEVASKYNEVRKGDSGALFLIKKNGRDKVAIIKLQPSETGDFYNVETGGFFRKNYLENKELLWGRSEPAQEGIGQPSPAVQAEPKISDSAPLNATESNSAKGTTNDVPSQGKGPEVLENKKPGAVPDNHGELVALVKAFNDLSKSEKKSTNGQYLKEKIAQKVKDLGYTHGGFDGDKLVVLNKNGKRIRAVGKKRSPEELQAQKDVLANRKRLLNQEPIDLRHALLQFFAGGGKINAADFARYKGKAEGKKSFWGLSSKAVPLDIMFQSFSHDPNTRHLVEGMDDHQFADFATDVLNDQTGRGSVEKELNDIQFKVDNNGLSPDQIRELEALHGLDKGLEDHITPEDLAHNEDLARELTDEEVEQGLKDTEGYENWEKGNIDKFISEYGEQPEEKGAAIPEEDGAAKEDELPDSDAQQAKERIEAGRRKAESEFTSEVESYDKKIEAAKKERDNKIKDFNKRNDLFGDKVKEGQLFDEGIDQDAIKDILKPLEDKIAKLKADKDAFISNKSEYLKKYDNQLDVTDFDNKTPEERLNLAESPQSPDEQIQEGIQDLKNLLKGKTGRALDVMALPAMFIEALGKIAMGHIRKGGNAFARFLQEVRDNFPDELKDISDKELEEKVFDKAPEIVNKSVLGKADQRINDWLGDKDYTSHKASVEAANVQEEIKATVPKKKLETDFSYKKRWTKVDQAIQVYLDLKGSPEDLDKFYDKLSPEQKEIVDLSKNLTNEQKAIADRISEEYKKVGQEALDEGQIGNMVEGYVARSWDFKEKNPTDIANFKTATRHKLQRSLSSILEGWSKGYELKIKGATNNLQTLKIEIGHAIENKKLIDEGSRIKTSFGDPLFSTAHLQGYEKIENGAFKKWDFAGKIGEYSADQVESFGRRKDILITPDGTVLKKSDIYAPSKVARDLNKILGRPEENSWAATKAISRFSNAVKGNIFLTSFFHHLAFARAHLEGGTINSIGEISPRAAYKKGLALIKEFNPEVRLLIENGLTLGKMQEYDEVIRESKSLLSKKMDKYKFIPEQRAFLTDLIESQNRFLFEKYGAGLKALDGVNALKKLIKDKPDIDPKQHAADVARFMNQNYGGLNLKRMKRDPKLQLSMRLLLLAPDWTESNLQMAADAFKKGTQGEFARKMWGRVIVRGVAATALANIITAFGDDKDDQGNPISYGEAIRRRYKKAWEEGRLRWLEWDVTPLYRNLGGDQHKRVYFSFFGHFSDPMKMLTNPIDFFENKLNPASVKVPFEALTGENWKHEKFTTLSELMGIDDKGVYKTTVRKGEHQHNEGDEKGGKLKGKLTSSTVEKHGGVGFAELPSYALSTVRGWIPTQVANLEMWGTGENDAVYSIAQSVGLGLKISSEPKDEEAKNEPIKHTANHAYHPKVMHQHPTVHHKK